MNGIWSKYLTPERLRRSESPARGDEGNEFLSDYQRVVFSSAFRRLQDKTQVSPLATTDFVRRRLTHSVEVATVGERMGRVVARRLHERVGQDVRDHFGKIVATACLLHDIGNPPFGHEGEMAIREWAEQVVGDGGHDSSDYRAFDGNAQGFRIAVRLHHHGKPYGANLTSAALACMVKYPKEAQVLRAPQSAPKLTKRGKFGYLGSEATHFAKVVELTGLRPGQRHPLSFVMEAADDIVNRLVDLEDGLKLGLVEYDEILAALTKASGDLADKLKSQMTARYDSVKFGSQRERQQLAYQHFRAEAVAAFADSCEHAFVENIEKIEQGAFECDLMEKAACSSVYSALKELEYSRIFDHPSIVRVEAGGKVAVRELLRMLYSEVRNNSKLAKMIPEPPLLEEELREKVFKDEDLSMQRVVDYVSGMTDRFAVDLYQQLSGVAL